MAWNDLIGHERNKKILQKSILDNRIAHAYCFWGIDGIGKDSLAIEFAKTVNCYSPVIENESINACGTCKSCNQVSTLQHPNLHLIFSLPAGQSAVSRNDSPLTKLKDDQIERIQEEIALKAADPFHRISITGANQIRIASIRDIKRNLNLTATTRGHRFVIIFNADEMTGESANAFLKTLEEPHERITIILTTSKHEIIPQTIISRCQQVRCQPLPDELISAQLIEKYDLEEGAARIISSFGQGSLTKAESFLDEDTKQLREDIVELLRNSLRQKTFRVDLLEFVDDITKAKDRKKIETFLTLLQFWLRDAYVYSKTQDRYKILNFDQADIIIKFAERFQDCKLDRAISEASEAVKLLKRNVNPKLILLSLFISLRDIFLDNRF